MSEPNKENGETLRELRKISKILLLANAAVIENELSKIANSDARKKMWVLIDGKHMPKDLATQAGVTQMAVSNFLNACFTAEFIEYARGEPPRRILNYVPPDWINLVKFPSSEASEEKKSASQDVAQITKEEGNRNESTGK